MSLKNTVSLEQQADGSFKEVVASKKLVFTPAEGFRWYRVARIVGTVNGSPRTISGTLKIYGEGSGSRTYVSAEISLSPNERGTITQTGYTTTGDSLAIYLRVARNQGVNNNELVLDILAGAQTDVALTLEGFGPLFPDFEAIPEIVGCALQDINRSGTVEVSRLPWDEYIVAQYENRIGIDTTNTTNTPAGPYYEADVAFYWNNAGAQIAGKNYSIENLAEESATPKKAGTWVSVTITTDNLVGIARGTYAGMVISRSAQAETTGTFSGQYRVTVRLRGLVNGSKWIPANKGSLLGPSAPNHNQWQMVAIAGGFNGLFPNPPGSNDPIHQANILELGQGLITNRLIRSHHGNYEDPDMPLRIGGRAGYLHALSLLGGAGRFTVSTDHFHLFFSGGLNSNAGFWTPQSFTQWPNISDTGKNLWNRWQMQNANGGDTNDIFLGGLTEFFFGSNAFNQGSRYGVSTLRVELTGTGTATSDTDNQNTSPGPPKFDAEVDFYFNSYQAITVDSYVTVNFPIGHVGIAAAILAGQVISAANTQVTAPDGATGKFLVTIRLEGLKTSEWFPDLAGFTTSPRQWTVSRSGNPVGFTTERTNVSLSLLPTRRDKIIATYSSPHDLNEGQVVVFNLFANSFIVTAPGISNSVVSKVISPTVVEVLLGTCRRAENLSLLGMFKFSSHAHGSNGDPALSSSNLYWVNSNPSIVGTDVKDRYYRVKLKSLNNLPVGLEPDRDYWMRLNQTYPQYFLKLYNSLNDARANTNAVEVSHRASYGQHYLVFYTSYDSSGNVILDLENTPSIDGTNWDLHKGSTDPVHQQTFGDVGFYLHRNIYPNTKGAAQGVITQGVFGGLCEVPYLAKKAFSYGWNSAAEEDDTVAIGLNIRNNTQKSIEIGASNNFKLRLEENKISTVGTGILDLTSRPTVNGTGVLLSGEAAQLPSTIVYTTGNQSISGIKTFGSNNVVETSSSNSTILGGSSNTISGSIFNSFISNGISNILTGSGLSRPSNSYIGNGRLNIVKYAGPYSTILNGLSNRLENISYSIIGNGEHNSIFGSSGVNESSNPDFMGPVALNKVSLHSILMGGAFNSFSMSDYLFLGNGVNNCIGAPSLGAIGGGEGGEGGVPISYDTESKATYSSIINGSNNRIIGNFNLIGGGSFNQITGGLTFDGCCQMSSRSNVIAGGANNSILNSSCSAILGGRYNEVIHNGATVIGDGSLNVKTSRGACSLLLSFGNSIHLESPIFNFTGGRPTVNSTGVLLSGEAVAPLVDINNITGNFNFSSSYNSKLLTINASQNITGTVPTGLPTGYNVSFAQMGAGKLFITGSGGAVVRQRLNLFTTAGQYGVASLVHYSGNQFLLYGDLI